MGKYKVSEDVLKKRVICLFFLGLLLMIVIEVGIGWVCGDWGRIRLRWLSQVLGPVLIVGGIALVIWSVITQYKICDGTPAPIVATQKLVPETLFLYAQSNDSRALFFILRNRCLDGFCCAYYSKCRYFQHIINVLYTSMRRVN
jgi:hypothetical protein